MVGSLIAPALAAVLGGPGALVATGGAVLAYALLVLRSASNGAGHAARVIPVPEPAMAEAVPAR